MNNGKQMLTNTEEEGTMMTLNYEAIEEFIENNMDFPQKNSRRAYHKTKSDTKAERKEKLANEIYPDGYHAAFGYFRKGKIHCSCPMCAAKTNGKLNKSRGPVDGTHRRGSRLAVTNHRHGKKNYKPSDTRKIESMAFQLKDFESLTEPVFV